MSLKLLPPTHEILAAADRAATLSGHLTAHDRATDDVAVARDRVAQARAALPGRTLHTLADEELGDALLRLRALDAVVTTLAREQADAARNDLAAASDQFI